VAVTAALLAGVAHADCCRTPPWIETIIDPLLGAPEAGNPLGADADVL